jgi:hypothetical protein
MLSIDFRLKFTISVEKYERDGHEQRMPVKLVLGVALPRKAAKEVAGPGAHQDDGHES